MTMLVETQVRDFIIENFLFGDDSRAIDAATSLIENDLVDSTGILELVAFVEERFGISVADNEIVPDNFDSLARITAYVSAKTAASEMPAASEKAA
ncbi:MAG TPA: acyl carrier protein [Saliniramus sp.]|nr:acyl carrier protein [Saliniramus sp.]